MMQPSRRARGQNSCPQTWARGPALRSRQPFARAYFTASRMCLFGWSIVIHWGLSVSAAATELYHSLMPFALEVTLILVLMPNRR